MKNKKRNITMIAVLVFVCAAVALNWSYNNRWGHPDSEMVSVSGWVMEQFGRVPAAGDSFTFDDLSIQVTRVENHRIEEILVTRKASAKPAEE